jgi:hypothetical protein
MDPAPHKVDADPKHYRVLVLIVPVPTDLKHKNVPFSFFLFVRLPRNIQILDENGENIVLMTNGDDSEDSDEEDREFTVIVEDDIGLVSQIIH